MSAFGSALSATPPATAWRERWRRWLRPPRRLKVTREGWFYVLFTLGVGAAAINTGNNLLYLVLGLQLASIVISGILSEWAITGLELRSLGASDARAGEAATWHLSLRKRSGRLPSFTLILASQDSPARGAQGSVLRLAPGTETVVELRFVPPRRGRFVARRLTVATRFPFGLFEKERDLESEQEIFVYPRRTPPPAPPTSLRSDDGTLRSHRSGRGPEILSLRPLAPGDGLGQMHWRKSAQIGSWVVSVREREAVPRVELRLDLRARADPGDLERLEAELEQTAAGCEAALERGQSVSLQLGNQRLHAAPGAAGRRTLLRALAAAEPELGP